jgi:hypothetical protein
MVKVDIYPKGCASFKGSHDTTSKKNTVERHTWMSEFQRPFTGEIRLGIVASTESTTSD